MLPGMPGEHGIIDQNFNVWNQGKNPLVNFNFMLRVELTFDLPCKSVRAFSRELEYDYIQEGGLNDYVHMRRKPITRPFTLEIERYVGVDYIDPMPLGAELALPVLLFVSRAHDQFIPFVVARTYTFTGCTVIKKTYGDLVADQSGLLVETTTLAYREMLCTDIPWNEAGDSVGAPSSGKNKQAATADDSSSKLKELGNELLAKAKASEATANNDYVETDVDAVIQQVKDASTKLDDSLSSGGSLNENLQAAKAGLKDSKGRPLEEITKELQDALPPMKAKVDEAKVNKENAYPPVHETETTYFDTEAKLKKAKNKLTRAKKKAELAKKEGKNLDTAEKDVTNAQAAYDSAKSVYDDAKLAREDAMAVYEETVRKFYTARDAYHAARDAAAAASSAESSAKSRISAAESLIERGKKRKTELQNTLTNLTSRKKICAASQKACGKAREECENANTKLQGIDDAQKGEQNVAYKEVKRFGKEADVQQRKTSEIKNYLSVAQKILLDTLSLIGVIGDSSEET